MGNTYQKQSGVKGGKKAAPMAPNVFSMGPAKAKSNMTTSTGRGKPKSNRKESCCSMKAKKFLSSYRKNWAASRNTGGESHGASGMMPGPATGDLIAKKDVDRKSTRGSSVRKGHNIINRTFHRGPGPSSVGGGITGRGSKWSGPRGRGRRLVTSVTSGILNDKYEVEQSPLGRGFFGIVRKCSNKETGEVFAVKTIQKSKVSRLESLRREVAIMRCVDHPNIVKLYDVFEDDTFLHLVMELCTGGDLFDKMIEKTESEEGHFNEEEAKVIVSQILSGIDYCHSEHNICHRDLKPENFLFQGPDIKIIDFGLSRFLDGQSTMSTFIGTPYYMAPEILARKYNKACDLWALGVITFILLSGNMPFCGETDQEVFASVSNGYFDFKSPEWGSISSKAKRFITQLLKKDPCKRMTATQAMKHSWLRSPSDRRVSLAGVVEVANGEGHVINMQINTQDIYHRLKTFAGMSELQRVALHVIASDLPEADIRHLRGVFQLIDEDRDDVISVKEIGQVLRRNGVACRRKDLMSLTGMGIWGSNLMSFREFAAATVERDILVREENIRRAFNIMTLERHSEITFLDLVTLFESEERALKAMDTLNLSKSDVITYKMFKSTMMKMPRDSRGP